jgi:hypothetical protein
MRRLITLIALVTIACVWLEHGARAQHAGMPPGMTHEEHLAQMQKDREMQRRGTEAMGFDQEKTTHHFRLMSDGGSISVAANSADDTASRDQIRTHLAVIADDFTRGNFGKPAATHGEMPPGVEMMRASQDRIHYTVEDTPLGGIVRISITNGDAAALAAIHAFLRYQITEHKTGDSLAIQTVQTGQTVPH